MIKCIEHYRSKVTYGATVDDFFVSLGLTDDDWPAVIFSTWAAGSNYAIRAYRVSDTRVKQIFFAGSCSVPFYGINDRDRFAVVRESHGGCIQSPRWVTYYLTDHGPVRVPGFVKQR